MAAAQPGDTITLEPGIYTLDDDSVIQLGPAGTEQRHTVIQAAPGARVILTGQNGGVPRLQLSNYVDLVGLWIGGQRDINNWALPMGHHCRIEGCTIFGYIQAIIEGDGYANIYRDNRFVRCGGEWLEHPLYIAAGANPDKNDVVEGNLFVACDGWSIHLWHAPNSVEIINNFIGGALVPLALSGNGHTVQKNIFWSSQTISWNFGTATNTDFNRNVIREKRTANNWGEGGDHTGNYWLSAPEAWDTAPNVITEADLSSYLGKLVDEINQAIEALRIKFNDVAVLGDSATEYYFGILKSALDAWSQA